MRTTTLSRVFRSLIACAAMLSALPSRAQANQDTTTRVDSASEWYGPSVLAVYGVGYSAVAVGLLGRNLESQPARVGAAIILSAGVGTALFGVPITHWSHDELGAGLASLGGQVGALAAGGLIGYAASGKETTGLFVGAALGHVSFALADAFLLAHHERVLSIETTSARVQFVPFGLGGALRVSY